MSERTNPSSIVLTRQIIIDRNGSQIARLSQYRLGLSARDLLSKNSSIWSDFTLFRFNLHMTAIHWQECLKHFEKDFMLYWDFSRSNWNWQFARKTQFEHRELSSWPVQISNIADSSIINTFIKVISCTRGFLTLHWHDSLCCSFIYYTDH